MMSIKPRTLATCLRRAILASVALSATGVAFAQETPQPAPQDGKDACHANGGTVMFKAGSKAMADAWYEAGLANGGSDVSGPPAPGALPGTVMGYLRDPTGNKVAVVAFV